MDFLTSKIRPMFFKFFVAAFGSTLISSIYGIVDMAMVGQYQGPDGTAALAAVSPVWNVIYSLGLLTGIGGSVMFSHLRGRSLDNLKLSNEYFTAATIYSAVLSAIIWVLLIFFDEPILTFFGAETEVLLTLAKRYLFPIKFVVPVFLMNSMLSAFVRNDGNPALATKSVLAGGIFNVFGDYFFVFALDMGIFGAGLATAMGSVISLLVMLTHFFSKKCTVKFEKPTALFENIKNISVMGFSTFFVDIAMGILTVLFNRQILKYLGTDALAVYAVIINISTFVQCCAYSVGQAAQPIISTNLGAGKSERIRETLKYSLYVTAGFSVFWTAVNFIIPNGIVNLFMDTTPAVLKIAPEIIIKYSISYLLLPLNVFSTFYFQALMKPGTAFVVSAARGAVISCGLILLLPMLAGASSLWFAMPLTELSVSFFVIAMMIKYTKSLPKEA